MLTDTQVQEIVADALVKAGHGNVHFIASVRAGEQNDGPFMRGALAVRDAIPVSFTTPTASSDSLANFSVAMSSAEAAIAAGDVAYVDA